MFFKALKFLRTHSFTLGSLVVSYTWRRLTEPWRLICANSLSDHCTTHTNIFMRQRRLSICPRTQRQTGKDQDLNCQPCSNWTNINVTALKKNKKHTL